LVVDGREFKDGVFGHFARVGAALGHGKRVELIDVLAQGERSVEDLAREVSASVGNTSRHLQVLAGVGLVARRVEGSARIYRLADPAVLRAYQALVAVAEARIADVAALASAFFGAVDGARAVSLAELREAMAADDQLTLIDVRPEREFASGHVPGAVNVPLAHLAERLSGLPRDAPIVAYCRGPYCVMAAAAVHQLRAAGFPAARLQVGYPDWLTASGAAPAADRTRRN